ncbi:hypothetical protein DL95DRAFT_478854 [Leptodontidium sp. 2 PMI_412]|nr:hypothetical protein DL95DRAFT_478854 [Leptodontidium sp. 2 PMI_412]
MDPGTALAIVGLVLDGVKDVYAYYSTWKDRDQEVAEVRRALLWLIGLFQSIQTTLASKNLDKGNDLQLGERIRHRASSLPAQTYKNVMDWLNPSDQSEIHEAALRRHEAGTGQWFLGLDTFQNWRTDLGTSLWLCGEESRLWKGTQHDLSPILRTFIAQLCPRDQIPSSLKKLYDHHSSKFPPSVPSDDELKDTLLALIGKPKDAPSPISKDRELQLAPKYLKKVAEDMRFYVASEINKHKEMSLQKDAIKDLILRRLVEEGNGMFRWAALQLEELKALRPMKPRSINQALRTLPSDLDETYERILSKLPAGNTTEALSILRWISFAARPLFVEEIMEICAVRLNEDPEFDKAEYSNHFIARSSIAYLSCCNLFDLRKEDFPLRGYAWDHWAWHAAYQRDKDTEELVADAEALTTSIAHSNMQDCRIALQHLKAHLSYVAEWRPSTARRAREQEHALRLPFFFQEFESEVWEKEYTFDHQPLPAYKFRPVRPENAEIHLLELFPSSKRYGEIRCRIFHVLLDSSPGYDGVSYARRPNDAIGTIRANGLLLQMPRALVQDLRNLRAKTGSQGRVLFLWDIQWNNSPYLIDWQLRLNSRIFKQAPQVAIGLGIRAKGTTRPWWRRMWPVQELMLPRKATLYYGDEAITFDSFQKLFSSQQTIKHLIVIQDYSVLVSDRAWMGAQRISLLRTRSFLGHHPTLPELLWGTELHLEKDRVDKVYALFGLLEPEEQDSEFLAHDASKSDEENFVNVAVHIINRYRDLDILSYASHHRPLESLMPSRVPDFSIPGDDVRPLVEGTFGLPGSSNMFNVGGSKSDHPKLARNSRSLIVQGYSFDDVRISFRAFDDSESGVSLLDLYTTVKQTRAELTLETFWRNVQAGQKDGLRLGTVERDIAESTLSRDECPESGFCKGKRLVLSSEGHLCLAPVRSQVGDKIVVLVGGKVPYILRKTDEGFAIIGERYDGTSSPNVCMLLIESRSYVHGIMDREILSSFAANKGAGEDFRIC